MHCSHADLCSANECQSHHGLKDDEQQTTDSSIKNLALIWNATKLPISSLECGELGVQNGFSLNIIFYNNKFYRLPGKTKPRSRLATLSHTAKITEPPTVVV